MKRKILQEAACHRCSEGWEDILHSVWSCEKLKVVWERDFGWALRSGNALNSFTELLKLIQSRPHSVALFAATAWSIWYHRNKSRLNDTTLPLEKISGFARDYIQDFNKLITIPPCSHHSVQRRWSPPIPDYWKVNFDGAMFGESDDAGIGVVIQNSNGKVRAALSEKIKKPPNAEILELLAAKRAVLFSLETGTLKAEIEGDAESVIKALQYGGWERAQGGHLIKDIAATKNSFQSISFSHVGRQGNAVAHALAQRARHSSPFSIWMEHVPHDIVSFLSFDFLIP